MLGIPYKWLVLIVVVIGTFMSFLYTTMISIALPSIMTDFSAGVDSGQLILSIYFLALALVIPTTGFLSDRFGTKRVYTLSTVGFTVGSLLCGLAWDINSLIVFRFLQGFTGGMIMPLGRAMLFQAVPRREIGFVMSIFGIPILLAPIFGPVIGGYLVETTGWRVMFYINLPVGVLGILLAALLLRESERIQGFPFDYKGFILGGIGFSTTLFALTRVTQDGWGGANVVALFAVSATALIAWVFVELTEEVPLLDLRVFRNMLFTQATIVFLMLMLVAFSMMFLLPVFLQDVRGLSPIGTALIMMPGTVAMAGVMMLGGRVYDKFGPRPLVVPGLLLWGYSLFQLHNVSLSTSDTTLVYIFILRGVSMGFIGMPVMTLALSAVPRDQVVRASALSAALGQVLPAFGTAAFATILIARQGFHFNSLSQTVTPDSLAAMQVLSGLERAVGQFGAADALVQQTAIQILSGLVDLQASMQAFGDVFLIAAILAFVTVLPGLFLRRPRLEQEEAQPARATGAAPQPAD